MKFAYFARPIINYGKWHDDADIKLIKSIGFQVIEITDKKTQELYKDFGMDTFRPLVELADALFFRSFCDGAIGAGVAKEILWAKLSKVPVFEVSGNTTLRNLSVRETRNRLIG